MCAWPKRQVSGNPLFFTISTAKGRRVTPSSPRRSLPMTRNALGRGLGALIREPEPQVPATQPAPAAQPHTTGAGAAAAAPAKEASLPGPHQIDIDLIEPSPYQPRTRFREEALDELARSIKSSGI